MQMRNAEGLYKEDCETQMRSSNYLAEKALQKGNPALLPFSGPSTGLL